MSTANAGILARKLAKPAQAESARSQTPMRALRMEVARASRDVFGAEIDVIGVEITQSGLDDLVSPLSKGHCPIGLVAPEGLVGLVIADPEVLAAAGEMMTTGRIRPTPAEARSPTEVDAALIEPFLTGLMTAIQRDCGSSSPGDWFPAIAVGRKFSGVMALRLALPERPYKIFRMTLDLGAGGRQGEIAFALPAAIAAPEDPPERHCRADWPAQMSDVVMQKPTEVEAILGRFRLPLAIAEALKVGQVLLLLELDIGAVSLEASDGSRIANCRLGQSGGMRAVRVEPKPEIVMEEGGHFNAHRMRLPENTIDDPLEEPMPIQGLDD